MRLEDYAKGARVTESLLHMRVWKSGDDDMRPVNSRLLHAAMGLCTEAGEIMDVVKRHVFYGKELDHDAMVNLLEEAGDLCWYIFGILIDEVSIALGQEGMENKCLAGNLDKLRMRYGEKFSAFDAMHRDTVAEITALKQQLKAARPAHEPPITVIPIQHNMDDEREALKLEEAQRKIDVKPQEQWGSVCPYCQHVNVRPAPYPRVRCEVCGEEYRPTEDEKEAS